MLKKTIYCVIPFLVSLAFFSCKEKKEIVVKQVKIEFKHEANLQITDSSGVVKQELQIELADNTFEQQTGLMYRMHLDQNKGMLFIFEDTIMRSFYMKNTYISLDLIYLDAEHNIVSIVKSAEPLNEKSLPSEAPAKYVLEINGGLSDIWGLIPGDKINYNKL